MRQCSSHLIQVLVLSLVLFLALAAPCQADFQYRASVSAGQEYNDNVNESANPKGDFITVMSASVLAGYVGSRLDAAVDYHGKLRIYDTGQRQDELINDLEAKATLQLVKDFLVLDVADSNHMVYYNATRGETEPADSTAHQVNQNILTGGLTVTPRITDRTQLTMGYRATGALYDSNEAINKHTQTGFVDVLHALTEKLEIGADLQYQRQTTDQGDLSRYRASAVGRYTYGDGCYLFGRVGAVQSVYDIGSSSLMPLASAGLTHTLGRTVFQLSAQADYMDNPSSVYNSFRTLYSATVTRTFERGAVSGYVGYSDYSGQDTETTKNLTYSIRLQYALTPRLDAQLSASRIVALDNTGDSDRFYTTATLQYQMPKDTSLKLYHMLKINDAISAGEASYHVNIVGLQLTKSF